jgi:hypothetical protein
VTVASKKKGKPPEGVVVDVKNPRKAMIEAGWGRGKGKTKRDKPIPWVETVKKMFGGGS